MINWNIIDTVLLDMDGTLLDLHFDNYFWLTHLPKRYAQVHQVDAITAQKTLNTYIKKYEGTLQWYCLDHWSELTQLDIPALKHEIKHKIQLRPLSIPFLQQLRHLGKNLLLVTNAHPKGLALKIEQTRIDQWLDKLISSHDLRKPKEDPNFWQQLQASERFDPKRTAFIDDTPRILKQGQNFGLSTLICVNQPDSQRPAQKSDEFIDICHFDEIMPELKNLT